MRLLRTYPKQQDMTRRFFSEKMLFQCRLCRKPRESRYRIESPVGVICGQCYSDKLAGIPVKPRQDKETKPWGPKRKK